MGTLKVSEDKYQYKNHDNFENKMNANFFIIESFSLTKTFFNNAVILLFSF